MNSCLSRISRRRLLPPCIKKATWKRSSIGSRIQRGAPTQRPVTASRMSSRRSCRAHCYCWWTLSVISTLGPSETKKAPSASGGGGAHRGTSIIGAVAPNSPLVIEAKGSVDVLRQIWGEERGGHRFWCPPRSLIYRQESSGEERCVLYSSAASVKCCAVGVHQHGKGLDMGGASIISVSNVAISSSAVYLTRV